MRIMRARYILRFDDLCPTMNWVVWSQVEGVLLENKIKPLLAVVPKNRDPNLKVAEENPEFWNCVRRWQERDWTIGLHGYEHLMRQTDSGMLGFSRSGEFAGLPEDMQRSRLDRAIEVMRTERVRSDVWIAPGHSFDQTTIRIVREAGFRIICDGCSLLPYTDNLGIMWIPQSMWRFRRMWFGVWTICLHYNKWTSADIESFRKNVFKYRKSISDVRTVVNIYRDRRIRWHDRLFQAGYCRLIRLKRQIRRRQTPG